MTAVPGGGRLRGCALGAWARDERRVPARGVGRRADRVRVRCVALRGRWLAAAVGHLADVRRCPLVASPYIGELLYSCLWPRSEIPARKTATAALAERRGRCAAPPRHRCPL